MAKINKLQKAASAQRAGAMRGRYGKQARTHAEAAATRIGRSAPGQRRRDPSV